MTPHPAITVSRTLGSGGAYIAYRVAQRLGWRCCDRTILRTAAESLGLEPSDLDRQEERPENFLDRLLRMLPLASPEVPYVPPADLPVYCAELFGRERLVMQELLASGPAVIVGRGGFIALKDRPATLHVHIKASLDFRIHRLLKTGMAASADAARQALAASDRDRSAFIKAISGRSWDDPRNFDLVLDASQAGLEGCEAAILAAAEHLERVPHAS